MNVMGRLIEGLALMRRLCTSKRYFQFSGSIFAARRGAETAHKDNTRMEKVAVVGGGLVDLKGAIRNIRRFNVGAAVIENFSKSDPIAIEASGRSVPNDWIYEHYYPCERALDLIEVIDAFRKSGADAFVFADLSPDPYKSIRLFSKSIIPYFRHG